MYRIYRLFTFLICLATILIGICYSATSLMTLSQYVYPGKVVLLALSIIGLLILVVPGLLADAMGVKLGEDESPKE